MAHNAPPIKPCCWQIAEYGAEDGGDVIAKLAGKLGVRGNVRLVVSTQGHEGRISDTGVGDGTISGEALGISRTRRL